MLIKILRVIYEKGTFSSKIISRETNISVELVEEFKEKLEKMELVKKEEKCETNKCKGCSCGCSSKNLSDLINWEITEKGMRLLEKTNRRQYGKFR